jgi:hypothetical protein
MRIEVATLGDRVPGNILHDLLWALQDLFNKRHRNLSRSHLFARVVCQYDLHGLLA